MLFFESLDIYVCLDFEARRTYGDKGSEVRTLANDSTKKITVEIAS